ncbi:MAG: UDP-forming cellulose synthase catalytic subunit [Terracidiphilus sp.]|jgi:cellulose synthase (UDP-forming)
MTATGLWLDIGAGENLLTRILRLVFLLIAGVVFFFLATLPLTWPQQAILGLVSIVVALAAARFSDSYLVTLTLVMLSMFCTFRYGYWRIEQVVRYFHDPASHLGALDVFFILCLLLAEVYAFGILFLGYFQTIWPLRRAPVALPDNPEDWPHVDVLIPTYNEPLDVVRYTALGALNMDWPVDKLHVYILDDGHREEFAQFAHDAGIGYRTRPDNQYAKGGNINAALKTVSSPFVAVFDSDHVPTRSFLQMTLGWFLRDTKLAMLQTPHHFYSPDPFERNLGQFRVIPNEGELFYGIVQDGNDFWNASFFCGSCAVLRRSALDEVGGIATDTVTEDAHTSLRLQIKRWNSAYVNIPQAAGLATERLSAHIGQRIRWARGMVQVLRIDNPLLAPGLTFAQRLCYFNAMGHFLYAVPRLIFLTAPLIYLLLNHTNIPGFWLAILAYALPHLTLSNVTNSRIQGEHRYSFWNEIYETVLAPYILLPTMMALLNPKLGKFNVTAKGGVVKRTFFDARIAQPFLVMLFFNILGLIFAIPRFFVWDVDRRGTVLMNVMWCLFNIVILGVCIAVARELQQRRTTVRVGVVAPLVVTLPGGKTVTGETVDISSGGAGIRLSEPIEVVPDARVRLAFPDQQLCCDLPAAVVSLQDSILRVNFKDLSIPEQETLTVALFSRADSWLSWSGEREGDHVLRSLAHIFRVSAHGLKATFQTIAHEKSGPPNNSNPLSIARTSAILMALALFSAAAPKSAAQPIRPGASDASIAVSPVALPTGQYRDTFTLADAGSPQIEFHNIDSTHNIYFTLPQTHAVRTAKVHVYYAFSPGLIPQLSHLKLSINGTMFATIQPLPGASGGSDGRTAEAEFPIPPELLVHSNALTIEFIGHYAASCEDPANTALWSRVLRNSFIETTGDLLPLADDLKELPAPFIDPGVIRPASVSVVFPAQPSLKAIQAAGIVASYFGLVSENHPVRFPVAIGAIPQGDAIVIVENPADIAPSLNLSAATGPTLAMRTNPSDPYGKILVVTGTSADDAIVAAQAVALGSSVLTGPQTTVDNFKLPVKRAADDAPRWARTDQTIPLWDYASAEQLEGDGTAPLSVYFRIPPDLYYGTTWSPDRPNATLRLAYRYNSVPIGPISSMQVRVNNAFLGSVPLFPAEETSRTTQTDVPVPVVNLRPFSNSLSFDFTFQWLRKQHCDDTTPINMQGAILRDSYLDLRGYQHWTPMPNLEIFANAGFPFTRFADLSETTVVLPPVPTPQEIEVFLTLMGHFGRQTGFPGVRVTVSGTDSLRAGAHSDFLVIGAGDDQPAFDKLGTHLPVSASSGRVQVHDTQGFFERIFHNTWWKAGRSGRTESGELAAAGSPDALIEGTESPYDIAGSRSIVAIHLKDAAAFEPFLGSFLQVQQSSDISGSVSVLHGSQFQSFRIGAAAYHVGALNWLTSLTLWFAQVPWLGALIVVGIAFLLAIWTRQWLRGRARARLTLLDE